MDPYKVLGVSEDANKDQLKKAYRKLAAQYHPDKGGDEDKFKEVNNAYSILSDDQKRQQYHEMRNGPQFNFEDMFSAFGDFGFDPFAEIFNQGKKPRRREVKKEIKDKEIVFNLKVSLYNIKKGVINNIRYERNRICTDCQGEGGEGKQPCHICGGSGIETVQPNRFLVQQMTCRTCGGLGFGFRKLCSSCHGNGFHKVQESVQVEIKEKK